MGVVRKRGGYRTSASSQLTTVIYDATVAFCAAFIDAHSRTVDRMVQAARSGRQNIAEGSRAGGTSSQTELRLVNVARASLEELLLDYEDFLRQRGLPQWRKDSREAAEVRNIWRERRMRGIDRSDQTNQSDSPDWRTLDDEHAAWYAPWLADDRAEIRANALICLIHQANDLLDQQIVALERGFVEEGGYSERLAKERLDFRRNAAGRGIGSDCPDQTNRSDRTNPTNPKNPTDQSNPSHPTNFPTPVDLTVIILAGREERHIGRCLDKLAPLAPRQIFIVESQKDDRTHEIAVEKGATFAKMGGSEVTCVWHDWPGLQAKQLNWALDNLPIKTKWVLRLDADEYLYPETIEEVKKVLPTLDDDVTSLSLSRARAWQGKRIRYGTGKVILKRFFRTGIGRCEERQMDEHIVTSRGRDLLLKGEFADDNLMTLREWTVKHLDYAEREARDLLMQEYEDSSSQHSTLNPQLRPTGQAGVKRRMKGRYGRLPLFWRSFAYFIYRYFLRGGFLEGRAGFTWHFFQGWWYRSMVDARIDEIKRACNNDATRIRTYLQSAVKGL